MAIERFLPKEIPTSMKMNSMVDAVNNNEEANKALAEAFKTAPESLDANMQNVAENVGNVGNMVDTLEYRIGQYPQMLLGHGVPSASVRPINLGNDKHTGLPLPWLGTPEFVGQMYIDIDASNGGLYYAIPTFDYYGNITSIKWGNANL